MATALAYNPVVSMTGVATTAGSSTITVVASTSGSYGVAIGAVLSHANIPAGTTIIAFPTTTTATMSANATVTGSSLTVTATNPTTINLDQIPIIVKTGGDTFAINGTNIVIDGHSRFDLNSSNASTTAATSLGSITLSATLGGTCTIDGRNVRLLAYTSGSGTLPAMGSTVTMGGASGKIICVTASHTSTPVTSGTIPASGYIHIKQWNGTEYTSGAITLSGITATSSGASIVGYLEILGDEASTINANRLGTFNSYGAWFNIGTTNGTSNQTMQIPNNGTLRHIAGVFIEQTAGAKDYEFYMNAGTTTTTGTEAARGKVVWIDNTGLVRIGNSGSATNGYTPPAGLAVVVGNIFFCNCGTSARSSVAIPNATLATRYDFTSTGGGVVNIDKCNMEWYLSLTQPYSVALSNSGFVDAIFLDEIATPISFSNIGVGNKPTTALLTPGLTIQYCYAGGTMSNCVFGRVSLAASGAYTAVLQDITGFTFTNCIFRANTIQANATVYSIYGTRVNNCTFTNPVIIEGSIGLITCDTNTFTNTIFIGAVSGTTVTTYAIYVWNISSSTKNCTFSGLTFPVTDNHPYSALLYANAGCSNIKLRNIGTRVAPLTFGVTNPCGLIYIATNNCSTFKIQRVYVSNTRTGISSSDNSCINFIEQNVWGDYADATDVMVILNQTRMGMGGTGTVSPQTSVYGTHWLDGFTSTTAGRIAILMNEPTTQTAGQVTLTNSANFTSAGGLYMPTIGQSATFEMPAYIIGHTGFPAFILQMNGGTATNYSYDYSIDKNDGAGFSAITTANYTSTTLGTAMNLITGIDASKGFKLRLKITTTTTNATAITGLYITTTSTTTAQDYQYPLETATVTINVKDINTYAVLQGARVYLAAASGGPLPTGTIILNTLSDVSGKVTTSIELASSQPVTGRVRFSTSPNFYKTVPISETINNINGLTLNVAMIPDV
jgi:hypothetical protein